MKIVIHFVKRDDYLFVIHLKFTFAENIKAVVSQVPVFRSRAALQLRKAFQLSHAARQLATSIHFNGGRAAEGRRQKPPTDFHSQCPNGIE